MKLSLILTLIIIAAFLQSCVEIIVTSPPNASITTEILTARFWQYN